MKQANLAVLGSVNIDHVLSVAHFPAPGETCRGTDYQTFAGGKGANQVMAAARSGCVTQFIACVGDDSWGAQMCAQFTNEGIDITQVTSIENCATGLAMIQVAASGENTICICAQANAHLDANQVAQAAPVIEQADALLMQLETPLSGITHAAQLAHSHGTQVVLNPAPAQPLDDQLLRLIDIITPNETEAEWLTGIAVQNDYSAAQAAQWLHDKGVGIVIITLGQRGAWVSEQGQGFLSAGYQVDATDTTAAGDTFNGALISELLLGSSMKQALNYAHAAAALSVTRVGAQSSIPQRDEVLDFIDQHAS